jgi:hypothetical protein
MSGDSEVETGTGRVDQDHLRLLAIFHYIGAGLALAGLCFLFIHYLFFHAFFLDAGAWKGTKQGPTIPQVAAFFQLFYLGFGLFLLASAFGNLFSAIFLGRRTNRTFSLAVAGLNCLHVPFGTVLGGFTFAVLLRPSVREAYEARSGPPRPLP